MSFVHGPSAGALDAESLKSQIEKKKRFSRDIDVVLGFATYFACAKL